MSGWRRSGVRLAGFAAAAAIAACQPLPHPFADDRPAAAMIAVPDNIDIAVGSFEGEPRATAAKLPAAIAHELLAHNIPASDMTTSRDSYRLEGRVEEHADRAGKSVVTVFWRLSDAKSAIVSERSDHLAASTRDWDNGDDKRVTQLAAAAAARIAALLTDETPKEAAGGGRTRVAVRRGAGAPGDGDASLAASLIALLKHRDIELVDAAKGRPDLDVDAQVKVDPPRDNKQHVKIVWHVARPAGGEIGQVAQENDIPRGRLDGPWGDIAYSVAMAAEGGIMQIVDRVAPPRKAGVQATAAPAPSLSDLAGAPATSAAISAKPAAPPVAGNIAAPEVILPPVKVTPDSGVMPTPLPTQGTPVPLPYRGVPIPH
ncbi:MAG TPA: hypothetical protein VFC56_01840 [Stellaceae bacterium]|nr:hypothetical protein [Stellaceae bacterium]